LTGALPALPGGDGAWLPAGLAETVLVPLAAALEADALAAVLGAPLAQAVLARAGRDPEALAEAALAAVVVTGAARGGAARILRSLADAGVRCAALKGLATGELLYPHPAYRALPDVDILVRPEDVARAAAVLRADGFRASKDHLAVRRWGALTRASFAPVVSADGALLLDLHRAVDDPPAAYGLPAGDVLDAGRAGALGPFLLPSPTHAFIVIALHAFRDFYEPRIIKSLPDAALLVGRADLDWGEVEARARRGRFVNRLVLFRELLAACGVPGPPVFGSRPASPFVRRFVADAARNLVTHAWTRLPDRRKARIEIAALDRSSDVARLHARRVLGLVARRSHDLPGF
jgi:hypothetical protein